jgi:uncharacterized membrane protein YhaH (DUF805 family)
MIKNNCGNFGNKMIRTSFYVVISLLIISIPILIFGIINTMVSLKYETENPGDCISTISGTDLCSAINRFEIIIAINVILIIGLLIFRKKLIKK